MSSITPTGVIAPTGVTAGQAPQKVERGSSPLNRKRPPSIKFTPISTGREKLSASSLSSFSSPTITNDLLPAYLSALRVDAYKQGQFGVHLCFKAGAENANEYFERAKLLSKDGQWKLLDEQHKGNPETKLQLEYNKSYEHLISALTALFQQLPGVGPYISALMSPSISPLS